MVSCYSNKRIFSWLYLLYIFPFHLFGFIRVSLWLYLGIFSILFEHFQGFIFVLGDSGKVQCSYCLIDNENSHNRFIVEYLGPIYRGKRQTNKSHKIKLSKKIK